MMTEISVPILLHSLNRYQLQQDTSLESTFLRNQTNKHKRNVNLRAATLLLYTESRALGLEHDKDHVYYLPWKHCGVRFRTQAPCNLNVGFKVYS